jgi:multimeric flavodoxin WrbA
MHKILCVSGSKRKNGNSEALIQLMLKSFSPHCEVRWVKMSEINIQGCLGCDFCTKNHEKCVQNDDMKIVYDGFRWCDALVVSTPVYSRNVCSQVMALMDRHYAVKTSRPLEGKLGSAIAVGAGAGQAIAISSIHNWLLSCGALCVPGELNGITASGFEKGQILENPIYVRQTQKLAFNIEKYLNRLST